MCVDPEKRTYAIKEFILDGYNLRLTWETYQNLIRMGQTIRIE